MWLMSIAFSSLLATIMLVVLKCMNAAEVLQFSHFGLMPSHCILFACC
jgi:hypothetical protein